MRRPKLVIAEISVSVIAGADRHIGTAKNIFPKIVRDAPPREIFIGHISDPRLREHAGERKNKVMLNLHYLFETSHK